MTTQITLKYPVLVNKVEVTELNIRRPTVRDMKKFDLVGGDIQKMAVMAATLASIPEDSVNMMDASDFMRVTGVITDFLDDSPTDGETL